MREVIDICNIECYKEENGTIYFDLDDVTRGLGLIVGGGIVFDLLKKIDNQESLKFIRNGMYIPENTFHKLAIKVNTEKANIFREMVVDVVIPYILKNKRNRFILENKSHKTQIVGQIKKGDK